MMHILHSSFENRKNYMIVKEGFNEYEKFIVSMPIAAFEHEAKEFTKQSLD